MKRQFCSFKNKKIRCLKIYLFLEVLVTKPLDFLWHMIRERWNVVSKLINDKKEKKGGGRKGHLNKIYKLSRFGPYPKRQGTQCIRYEVEGTLVPFMAFLFKFSTFWRFLVYEKNWFLSFLNKIGAMKMKSRKRFPIKRQFVFLKTILMQFKSPKGKNI